MRNIIWPGIVIFIAVFFLTPTALAQSKAWDELFFKTNEAYKNGNYEESAEGYSRLIRSGHVNGHIYYNLGNAYFDTGDHEKAITAYKKALDMEPENADVWTDLGVMYRRSGNPTEAVRAFNKAIQINPRHQQSRFNKGIVLMYDLKDRKGALQAWQELVNINPEARAPNGQLVKELLKKQ